MSIAKSLATDLKDSLVPTTLAGETVYIHQGFLAAIESVYPDVSKNLNLLCH